MTLQEEIQNGESRTLKLVICSEWTFIALRIRKTAIKSAINQKIGNKSAINYKDKILEYLSKHSEARSQDIALFIGLKQSRTKDYLSELVEDGKIVANGANRNRTYSLKWVKQEHEKQ